MPSWRIDNGGRWYMVDVDEPKRLELEPVEKSLLEELWGDLVRVLPWLILIGGAFLLIMAHLYGAE